MSIDLYCEDCGRELEVSVGFQKVRVFPCEHCIEDARERGRSDGYEDSQESRDDEIESLQENIKHLNIAIQSLQEQLDRP